jgi:nucleotide-binding universal stress UspA family protein
MVRALMVPLDGSTFAEHALPWAAALARRGPRPLHLVQVHVPLMPAYGETGVMLDRTVEDEVRQTERDYLGSVVGRLAAVEVTAQAELVDGAVAEQLVRQAQSKGADLIVMTTHGRGVMSRLLLGSVADNLVRHTTAPVLLVRPAEGAPDLRRQAEVRKVLVPLDGSPLAEKVLGPLESLLEAWPAAEVILLRLVQPGMADAAMANVWSQPLLERLEKLQKELEAEARQYLIPIAADLRKRGRQVQIRIACHDQAAAGILAEAKASGADLIAMATHGHGGWKRALRGSVADKVLRAGDLPMLIVHPAEA